ncbi:Cytochrome f [Prochlorococcus marinus str. MIT 9515]|uniref:Cytochrome f n=2 Tax=Prochlorococcus marinus TaxID=1219 RepID=CYF_PROM5|nr:apocytochrome f [Prochlorococcus marinus]A2BVC3.1 RecName: Full=Cytochrome f; Flags: Precursor [Prochlorococcus marinus str. MIT 9515]ABM71734.1 Cytochrome f [Prochlorococcus marinus str. MIT 9515]
MINFKKQIMKKTTFFLCAMLLVSSILIAPRSSLAYPFWAQQNYESPREATGKIVCANCHLAQMPTIAEVPQAVGADSVFKAVVKIPYKDDIKEIGADGSEVPLQVGAVVMLPDGFKLAPQERWTDEIKEETEGVYFTNYSEEKENIIIVGPLPGDTNKEIIFPVLSPNPATNKEYHYGKYSLHIGGNRGRGQVYPTGDKSNNVIFTSSSAGTINSIETIEDGSYQINIENENGEITTEAVPVGPKLIVKEQDQITVGAPLTSDPNVGGFGQLDAEVVLQSPYRIIGLIAFFIGVGLTQILLVLKKKQVEKVQAAEGI